MASEATENSPLLASTTSSASTASGSAAPEPNRPKPPRTVTFNPNPVSKTIEPEPDYRRPNRINTPSFQASHNAPPSPSAISTGGLGGFPAALNNKLRRRNSHGSTPQYPNSPGVQLKLGPQRSTKNAQKLKLLPNPEFGDEGPDEESGRDVYSQYTRIKDPTARRDAARLGKADRDRLPRVTAYCTANKYQLEGLMRFLKGRGKARNANPKLIDECIYTPYSYTTKQRDATTEDRQRHRQEQDQVGQGPPSPDREWESQRRHSTGEVDAAETGFHQTDLVDLRNDHRNGFHDGGNSMMDHHHAMGYDSAIADGDDAVADFDVEIHTPEVFLFEYGVVVIWGMTLAQEQKFLKEIAKFEMEKLDADDVETEYFNFYYTREYQARIYNDFITLRDKNNYMTKLAISHALAQSVKVCPSPGPPFAHHPVSSTNPDPRLPSSKS